MTQLLLLLLNIISVLCYITISNGVSGLIQRLGLSLNWHSMALLKWELIIFCFITSSIHMCGSSRMNMVRALLRPYENRAWAQSNWVLVRIWQGCGFAFRYHKSPHLLRKLGPKLLQADSSLIRQSISMHCCIVTALLGVVICHYICKDIEMTCYILQHYRIGHCYVSSNKDLSWYIFLLLFW
jgi:hypothetical protein